MTGGKNHFVVHSILNHGTVRSYGRWSVPNWIPILWMPSELQSIYNPTSMCFMCKACHIYKSGQQRLFCVTPLFVVTTTACVYLRTSPAPRPTHTPCTTHPWWSKTGVHHSQTSFTTCRKFRIIYTVHTCLPISPTTVSAIQQPKQRVGEHRTPPHFPPPTPRSKTNNAHPLGCRPTASKIKRRQTSGEK